MAPRLIQQENLIVNQDFRIAQFTGAGFTPAARRSSWWRTKTFFTRRDRPEVGNGVNFVLVCDSYDPDGGGIDVSGHAGTTATPAHRVHTVSLTTIR